MPADRKKSAVGWQAIVHRTDTAEPGRNEHYAASPRRHPSVPPPAFCPPRPRPTPSSPLPRPRPKLMTFGTLLASAAMLSRDMPCATSSAAAVGDAGPAAVPAATPAPPADACPCCWSRPDAAGCASCAPPPLAAGGAAPAAAGASAASSSAAMACWPCPFWNCGSGRTCALRRLRAAERTHGQHVLWWKHARP